MTDFIEPVAYDAVQRFDLRDRVALVTGGAHGLGLAIVTAFLGAGAKVGVLDLDGEALEARMPEMAARGKVVARAVDTRDDDAVRAAIDDIARELGGIDILVNDAATFPSAPLAETDSKTLTAALDVNVVGYLRTVTAALPYLRASGRGRIINFGSVTFFLGHPDGLGAYIATKGAVTGLTRALAREVGVDGITANILAPGAFPTRAEYGLYEDQAAFDRQVIEVQSVKRRGDVSDIASAALFLASDAASFITGQTLLVDGGWTFN
ncbi:SDR family NAD(P)-dependent oxidoreductase [Paenarthrobacter sp. NPDC057981]|uniref:SDR family NAD(P)-dependent oxidoreductase n=1 Tax=Paenarthrobacter sp. NPDC057981 TaxID=3346297 RepID=UPI0036DA970D